jgi:hypothetical protein
MSELITVGYSTRKTNPEFTEYLKKSSGFKKINVIEKVNDGQKSLSQVYNEILNESATDILVFCHDDIYFESTGWYNKIVKHFEKSDYGILGVAGTTSLTDSGRWWDEKNKMVGIVNHEHEGKKWESKYSESFENGICETLIVDGLFFAVNKKRIKKNFDESFKGFHFYDVSFSFSNHLEGVKVGVITNIRITHKSIGMTNEEWERNRIQFAEKYKLNLPTHISYKKTDIFKVLISTSKESNFDDLNKVIDNLRKNKCSVSLISEDSKSVNLKVRKKNIHCYDLNNPPGYKLGDGKWSMNTPNGPQVSQPGMLYKVSNVTYDVILNQSSEDTTKIVKLYPEIPKINLESKQHFQNHFSIKKEIDVNEFLDNELDVIVDALNQEYQKNKKQKIKILSGYSERGGSTTLFVNLTNFFNQNGYDCTFYGPHDYHINKCKSGYQHEINFESNDVIISHFLNLKERPNVKKIVFSCHEKWWFDFSKVNKFWDTSIFLHEDHRKFHKNYEGEYVIIPNIKEDLYPIDDKLKNDLDLVAGVIGTIEDRKQTHVSIKRALSDGCNKVLLFGHIGDDNYFNEFIKPLISDNKVILMGHSSKKQDMYNSIGRVYHSSKGEVACLVKDECYSTKTKFFGNEETENEVSPLTNSEILNIWKKVLEI